MISALYRNHQGIRKRHLQDLGAECGLGRVKDRAGAARPPRLQQQILRPSGQGWHGRE